MVWIWPFAEDGTMTYSCFPLDHFFVILLFSYNIIAMYVENLKCILIKLRYMTLSFSMAIEK